MELPSIAVGALIVTCFLALRFYVHLNSVQFLPGYRPMISPFSLVSAIFPHSWYNLNPYWPFHLRKTGYFGYTHDIIAVVPWLISGGPIIYTCSPDVIQQLLGNENQLPLSKPPWLTSTLLLWGDNIFSSDGPAWKIHRKLMAPAFTSKIYNMVIQETASIYQEMVKFEKWDQQKVVNVPRILSLTQRLAFLVIARCGFGLHLSWDINENEVVDNTNANNVLTKVIDTTIPRIAIPRWLYAFPIKGLQEIETAWTTLGAFFSAQVKDRTQELLDNPDLQETRSDVFTRLVSSNVGAGKYALTSSEVIGNTFMLMFAGHESTAMVLNTTLGFLGLYQEHQEKVLAEIRSVLGGSTEPTIENLSKLTHTMACFDESLRLFPAGPLLTRVLPEDIPIDLDRPVKRTVVLKKGTFVIFDMIGTHRNPHFFPNPDVYDPSRWYGVSETDITMFGRGPRACIGRKFSHIEALTFLSLLLREWHVDIIPEEGESREMYRERVFENADMVGLAFGVVHPIKLKLTRRVEL